MSPQEQRSIDAAGNAVIAVLSGLLSALQRLWVRMCTHVATKGHREGHRALCAFCWLDFIYSVQDGITAWRKRSHDFHDLLEKEQTDGRPA